jgi:hypothetical protein
MDSPSTPTALDIEFVDINVPKEQRAPLRFTFYWLGERAVGRTGFSSRRYMNY